VGQAKQKRLSIKDCYLCRKPLEEPTSPDHVPPKLVFPEDLRKKYKLTELLTIRVHHACNQEWRLDEEYFIHTLLPFARGTESGDAAAAQSFRKYKAGRNVPLINMVMDEFKHVVKGVHLPANRVAKLIDANRFHDVLYKIVRGLHFHHTGEILAPIWSITYTVTAPNEPPPDFFVAYAESGRGLIRGKYPSIFAYMFDKFPEVNDLHFWAFLLWDCIIVTAAFHDMNCVCEYCSFIGPRLPESMPGTIRA
jgi:hypothetical protein